MCSCDLPEDEIESKLGDVKAKIEEVKKESSGCTTATGGSIWVVPTFKDVGEWQPIGKRELPDVEWIWNT